MLLAARNGTRIVSAALAICGTFGVATTAVAVDATRNVTATQVVKTADGAVRGSADGAVTEFLGIPYAKAPVGDLRWRPPRPPTGWRGVREARAFGAQCPQFGTRYGSSSTSEDCLFLNVYVPASPTGVQPDWPVVVWIHGGALVHGASDHYDPSMFATAGAIVVTLNYRLGALGFLAHPALAEDPAGYTGNYGWMDQQAALRWVQKNIGAFGGDRDRVTIAGQEAGGTSVLVHLAAPGSRGLFQRAVVQSGSFATEQVPLDQAQTAGRAFASRAGCLDQTARCLWGLSVSAVLEHQDANGYLPGVVDGRLLPRTLETALASGQFNRVPVINGINSDEQRSFVAQGVSVVQGRAVPLPPGWVTAETYESTISSILEVAAEDAARIALLYPVDAFASPALALSTVVTDAGFACPALHVHRLLSEYVPVFAYEFSDRGAPQRFLWPMHFPYGAAHGSELQYFFGLPKAPFQGPLTLAQTQLASTMRTYWATFADRGVPRSYGSPRWPPFTVADERVLSLDSSGAEVRMDFAADHRCMLWFTAG